MSFEAYLSVYQNGQKQGQVRIDQPIFQIGRSRQCQLVVGGGDVSRLHATIQYHQGQFYLQDSSSAGTWVNNQRVSQITLNANDVIQIGQTQLRFHVRQAQPEQGMRQPVQQAVQGVSQAVNNVINPTPPQVVPAGADPYLRAMASTKSYIGASIIILIGYTIAPVFLGLSWIISMVFNVMYLREAKRMEQAAGHPLSGVGCLQILLVYAVISLLFSIALIVAITGGAAAAANSFRW